MTTPTKPKKARLKRLVPAAKDELPPLVLTERDGRIFEALYSYRVLNTDQIATLFFPSVQRCQQRLKLLFHHRYVVRRPQELTRNATPEAYVYMLAPKGAEIVKERRELPDEEFDWRSQDNTIALQFLKHLLKTNDVRIACVQAAHKQGWTIDPWIDDRDLHRQVAAYDDRVTITDKNGKQLKVAVIADGYFALHRPNPEREGFLLHNHHFIEIDMGTVPGERWTKKVKGYLAYHSSGKFTQRYGVSRFRVLVITTTDKRLAHLKILTEKAGGRGRFWFTTFDKTTSDAALTESIWQIAEDENELKEEHEGGAPKFYTLV